MVLPANAETDVHVLYLHQYFVPPGAPGGTRSLEIIRGLIDDGHRVTLITSDAFIKSTSELESARKFFENHGVNAHVIGTSYRNESTFGARLAAFALFALRSIVKAVRARDVDVVFATSTPLTIALPALASKFVRGRPYVFEVRDLWPEMPIAVGALRNSVAIALARWLERTAYRHAAHIIALSPPMARGVRESCGTVPVAVVPNMANSALFQRAVAMPELSPVKSHSTWPVGRTTLLYAGSFGHLNDVDYALDLATELQERGRDDVAVVLVGDGAQRERLVARASRQGMLGNGFHVFAPVPKRDVPALYRAADAALCLFVDVSEMEKNSSNKFFDALAAGRPVVLNYGGWQADLVRSHHAGVQLGRDPALAAEQVLALVDSPGALEAMQCGIQTLAAKFSRDVLVRQVIGVINQASNG